MSRKGENIYKRKDGRWEGRYKKGKNQKGKIAYGYVYAKTYKDVREKLTTAKHNAMQTEEKNSEMHLQTIGTTDHRLTMIQLTITMQILSL